MPPLIIQPRPNSCFLANLRRRRPTFIFACSDFRSACILYFWLGSLLLGLGGGERPIPFETVIWVAVVFVSILVHEMGHASIQQLFRRAPMDHAVRVWRLGILQRLRSTTAEPDSYFVGGPFCRIRSGGVRCSHSVRDAADRGGTALIGFPYFGTLPNPSRLNEIILRLLYVNIVWSLVNLLPIYPLDGGQISRQLFTLWNSRHGTLQSLQLSVGTAVLVAAYGFLNGDFYIGLMFGFLAYGNFQAIQFNRNHWR